MAVIFLWDIEGAIAKPVYLEDPMRSPPDGLKLVSSLLLPGPSLVHDQVSHIEGLISIPTLLGISSLLDSGCRQLVVGDLVVQVHVLEVLIDGITVGGGGEGVRP